MELTHESAIQDAMDFTRAYLVCALWSSVDDNDEPFDSNYTLTDISSQTLSQATKDCTNFLLDNPNSFNDTPECYTVEQAGHDFWLTRNGHGAGFWDRGLEDAGESLTQACEDYNEINVVLGDDGKIYFE